MKALGDFSVLAEWIRTQVENEVEDEAERDADQAK